MHKRDLTEITMAPPLVEDARHRSVELAHASRQDRPVLRSPWLTIVLLVCAALGAARVLAIDAARLQLDAVQGDGWRAQGLDIQWFLESNAMRAELTIQRLHVDGLQDELRDVRLVCPELRLEAEAFSCSRAQVRGRLPYIGAQQFSAAVSYQRRSGALALRLAGLKLAGGAAHIDAEWTAGRWRAALDVKQASADALLKLARNFAALEGFSAAGFVDAVLQAQGNGAQAARLHWNIAAQALTASNAAGTLASEALTLASRGSVTRQGGEWLFQAQLASTSGQAYAEPIFLDLDKYGLNATAQGVWRGADEIALQRFEIQQRELVQASGSGVLSLRAPHARELQLELARLEFPGAYAAYLQPFLLNTNFKALKTAGTLSGRIAVKDDWPHAVDLQLRQLAADDGVNRFVLRGVEGSIHWRNDEGGDSDTHERSWLRWSGGRLLGLELGAAELQLEAWGTTVRIAEPTRVPIFDGALSIDAFRIRKAGTPQMAFMLDAAIEPINVAQLCRAFGWPEFGGELAGKVTKLRLENGVLTLGATLSAQVFSGSVALSDLRMEGVFSNWPRFQAHIALNNLDLEQVTQAFSFGRITGRLSGEIAGLSLFNWEPVAFDARLYTPSDDRSRHRISQRAVQNIGSIGGSGGGVAAALQSGVLRFFDDFNYERLGISCRLENEVCRMNGVAAAPNGYYLVKGRGLPRIDVIGNAERVDWPRMVAQLKAVTESSGPVVR